MIERKAAGRVDHPGEIAGEGDERIHDIERRQEVLIEELHVPHHMAVIEDWEAEKVVRLLAELGGRRDFARFGAKLSPLP